VFTGYVMAQEGTREYLAIPKGRGFLYAYEKQLYKRVKTEGRTKYLKCSKPGCYGSAKIVGDLFFLGVCIFVFCRWDMISVNVLFMAVQCCAEINRWL